MAAPVAAAGGGGPGGGGDAGVATPAVTTGAPTGADGRFALAVPAPGRYRLRVTGIGLVPAEVRYVPVPSDDTRIVVARQVTITGVVVDGTTPVANAAVGLRGDAIGGAIEVRTDPAGAFAFPSLPEGRYQVFAYKEALAARAVRVHRLGAGPFEPVELRLEAATIVVGRVLDRDEGTGVAAAVELRASGDDQAPRYARSGDDGVFRIEGVPNGRWIADAFSPGYASPGGLELEAGRGIPELALVRGGAIEGRVLDGDGRPIAGAAVRALGGTTLASGVAASTGRARDREPIEVSAVVEQERLRRFSGHTAAPTTSAAAASADPQLLPRGELGVLVGRIPPLPPPGVPGARIASPTADPTVAALVPEPAALPADPARASIWITGADGRYRIAGTPRGRLAVVASAPGFADGRSRQVAIELGQVLTGVDVVLSPGTFLVGRVTDQHRVPIAGAQIDARPETGAPLVAFSDADGAYRVGPLSGTVELAATAYGHADAHRKLELAAARGTTPAERVEDLVLAVADAVLAGTLDDANGTPVAAASIEILGGAGGGRRAVTSADGTFAIEMLPGGPLRVRVTHPDYPRAELDATAVVGDRTRARLRLPLGGRVEGAVLDTGGAPLAGITISGTGPAAATAETTSGKDGRWKLGPLVPGRWKLGVKLPGYLPNERTVEVPAARAPGDTSVHDVRLDLERGALLGGTVRDDRGRRVAGAKVTIQLDDGPSAAGTTDSAGEFRIRDAPTGDVTITAVHGHTRASIQQRVRPGDEILGLSLELQ